MHIKRKERKLMRTIILAGWNVLFTEDQHEIKIKVAHSDGSQVSDTCADIGDDHCLGYRLTSSLIESKYLEDGDAKAISEKITLSIGDVEIELISDEDNHLNIYLNFDPTILVAIDTISENELEASSDLEIVVNFIIM
jgi:hypothetical protein